MIKHCIALIGMPGAGKSRIGRLLSARYKFPFVDLDRAIERAEDAPTTQIFAERGEEYFRALEAAALSSAATAGGCVIACGGGIVVKERNIKLLQDSCFTVFLRASLSTLLARVEGKDTRPLLSGDPESKLRALWEAREPLYSRAADCTVCVDAGDPAAVASEIVAAAEKAGVLTRGKFTNP